MFILQIAEKEYVYAFYILYSVKIYLNIFFCELQWPCYESFIYLFSLSEICHIMDI